MFLFADISYVCVPFSSFVDEIGKRSHAEYYYRVYKDNAQHSKIRKQAIEVDEEH